MTYDERPGSPDPRAGGNPLERCDFLDPVDSGRSPVDLGVMGPIFFAIIPLNLPCFTTISILYFMTKWITHNR